MKDKDFRKLKSGSITYIEKNHLKEEADKILEKAKELERKTKRIPYRIDDRTVILVTPSKYKQLKNKKK